MTYTIIISPWNTQLFNSPFRSWGVAQWYGNGHTQPLGLNPISFLPIPYAENPQITIQSCSSIYWPLLIPGGPEHLAFKAQSHSLLPHQPYCPTGLHLNSVTLLSLMQYCFLGAGSMIEQGPGLHPLTLKELGFL